MNEAAITLDGWYVLHDFRSMDWVSWKMLTDEERQFAIDEFQAFMDKVNQADENKTGAHALYSIVGQKADLMLMMLRETMDELNELETEYNKLTLIAYTVPDRKSTRLNSSHVKISYAVFCLKKKKKTNKQKTHEE